MIEKILIGNKGKDLWYPTYTPHIDIETGKSLLTEMYLNELKNDEQIDLLYHLIVELWYDVADDNMKKCGHLV